MVEPLLVVKDLKKHFPIRAGLMGRVQNYVKAVDGVSLEVRAGETLGLVGESGCGKTTVGRSILHLIRPTSGSVRFKGTELTRLGDWRLRKVRRDMQIIFQDPYSSLNPRMTVEGIVGEALAVHRIARGAERRRKVGELLERCGLDARHMTRYPHEFSGGQRQRVGVARALALKPEFIVCDEAVSALDVSIQAQVINLLMDIQEEFGISYLFIAHDLSVVEHISDRVAVMYLGRIMELARSETLYENPLHPYTRALLSAVPTPDPTDRGNRILLEGDVPTPIDPPTGCPFHTRCWLAEARCMTEVPAFRDVGGDQQVACHLVDPKTKTLRKNGKVIPPGSGKDWDTKQVEALEIPAPKGGRELPTTEEGLDSRAPTLPPTGMEAIERDEPAGPSGFTTAVPPLKTLEEAPPADDDHTLEFPTTDEAIEVPGSKDDEPESKDDEPESKDDEPESKDDEPESKDDEPKTEEPKTPEDFPKPKGDTGRWERDGSSQRLPAAPGKPESESWTPDELAKGGKRKLIYAKSAEASSSWSAKETGGWAASQVAGPPDVFPKLGDKIGAWAPKDKGSTEEWLEIAFPETLTKTIFVFETCGPGTIRRVEDVSAGETLFQTKTFEGPYDTARVFVIHLGQPRAIDRLKIIVQPELVQGYPQIDAVALEPLSTNEEADLLFGAEDEDEVDRDGETLVDLDEMWGDD